MKNTLETQRLHLRPVVASDYDFLFQLYQDPEVMKHIFTGIRSAKQTQESMDRFLTNWKEHDFGIYVVSLKAPGREIGYCGLRFLQETRDIEVGYLFAKNEWGKGYATEAAKACVDYAFDVLKATKVCAITAPEHKKSQHVLHKLGMKYIKDGIYFDTLNSYFEVVRS